MPRKRVIDPRHAVNCMAPGCDFVAKNEQGLRLHERKHALDAKKTARQQLGHPPPEDLAPIGEWRISELIAAPEKLLLKFAEEEKMLNDQVASLIVRRDRISAIAGALRELQEKK